MRCPRMRLAAALAAAWIAVITIAACATNPAADYVGSTGHASAQPPAAFGRRARLVSERWDKSALARVWRSGLVLTGGATLIQIPAGAGFDSQRQKDMFWSGHFSRAIPLPASSAGDLVRWASGATLRVPVENARAAFRLLSTQTACGGPYRCSSLGNLTVTGMAPVSVALPTSRGLARVPAWRFRLAQLPWTFTQVAVVPAEVQEAPGETSGLLPRLAGVSADGRTVTFEVPGGGCSGYPSPRLRALVYETATTVVIGTVTVPVPGPPAGQPCAGVGLMITVQARLPRALGSRVILDAQSGLPMLDYASRPGKAGG
jgi:hypothetical protein